MSAKQKKSTEENPAHLLDARGLFCPEPVMMLHNFIRNMSVGEKVEVLATDPSTQRDVPKFCNFLGHQLLSSRVEESKETIFAYLVVKSEPSEP